MAIYRPPKARWPLAVAAGVVGILVGLLVSLAFLQGLSSRELRPDELDHHDPDYEVLITVRAVKHAAVPHPVPAPTRSALG